MFTPTRGILRCTHRVTPGRFLPDNVNRFNVSLKVTQPSDHRTFHTFAALFFLVFLTSAFVHLLGPLRDGLLVFACSPFSSSSSSRLSRCSCSSLSSPPFFVSFSPSPLHPVLPLRPFRDGLFFLVPRLRGFRRVFGTVWGFCPCRSPKLGFPWLSLVFPGFAWFSCFLFGVLPAETQRGAFCFFAFWLCLLSVGVFVRLSGANEDAHAALVMRIGTPTRVPAGDTKSFWPVVCFTVCASCWIW